MSLHWLNNEEDIDFLESQLTETDKKIFNEVYKIFKNISSNWDAIFLSFLLSISKDENTKKYESFSQSEWLKKEMLDKAIWYIRENIELILENKKWGENYLSEEDKEIEEIKNLDVIKYISKKYTKISIDELIENLIDFDIYELEDWFTSKRLKKAKDIFLNSQWIFELLDEISDKNLITDNFKPRIDFI